MLGFLFTIILLIAVMAFAINYMNTKNNNSTNILIDQLESSRHFKKNAINHITNTLKELDYLGKTYKYTDTKNNSICYRSKGEIIDGCACHPSCKSCGYSDNPIGINQCLKCNNGTDVNVLYDNGAGWCGSFNESGNIEDDNAFITNNASGYVDLEGVETSSRTDISTNNVESSNISESSEISNRGYEGESCNTVFRRVCGNSADWQECLERNRTFLLTKGCSVDLDASKRFHLKLLPGSNILYKNEILTSENFKHNIKINNNGELIYTNTTNNTTKKLWPTESNRPYLNGPYTLKFHRYNVLSIMDVTGKSIHDFNESNNTIGVNSKVIIADDGKITITDNKNKVVKTIDTQT